MSKIINKNCLKDHPLPLACVCENINQLKSYITLSWDWQEGGRGIESRDSFAACDICPHKLLLFIVTNKFPVTLLALFLFFFSFVYFISPTTSPVILVSCFNIHMDILPKNISKSFQSSVFHFTLVIHSHGQNAGRCHYYSFNFIILLPASHFQSFQAILIHHVYNILLFPLFQNNRYDHFFAHLLNVFVSCFTVLLRENVSPG